MQPVNLSRAVLPFLVTLVASAQQTVPDMVLLNAKVFTSDTARPYIEALAIRGERIAGVGQTKEVAALAGKATKRIDLGGRSGIPGINDAHVHLSAGPDSYELQFGDLDPDWQQVKAAISAAVLKTPKQTWITGSFGTKILGEVRATRTALDELAPDHPVLLQDWTLHASFLNTLAFRRMGIREDEPNPYSGTYVRDSIDGTLTRMVFEFANFQLTRRFTQLANDAEVTKQLNRFLEQQARLGITTVQDMANLIPQDRCAALLARSNPPIRVRVIWFGLTDEHGRVNSKDRATQTHPAPLVTASGVKWILDGTPIERSAAMMEPYADVPYSRGKLDFSEKEMEQILRDSLARNDQLMCHVVGDRTARNFVTALNATGGKQVWSKRRLRIEHGDGITPDLIGSCRELGVVVVQNPIHFSTRDVVLPHFGAARIDRLFPFRSLLDAGIPLALGSDGPPGPTSPFVNILFATTDPMRPQEAITREQAVIAYTRTAAHAEFTEKDKGTLEPGKLADLAVLSQDIFKVSAADLPKTESVLTLVGGKVVYDAGVIAHADQ